ncbi:MAG: sulfatase-like hydrolase/transferase [Phycisphaerales bacterium]|nr:MAG: sulfatase-like hydrolase/transferase [Phycisphaerales bacterium]
MNRTTVSKYRILVLCLGSVVVILGLGFLFRADPAAPEVPLVLLISIDTCRADYLGCYGCSRETSPHIDAFARQGILFEHVLSPAPLTLPAHASMLTGAIPPGHGVRDNLSYRLEASHVTLAEVLRDSGYVTGAVVSTFVLDSKFGLDQGFDAYDDGLEEPTAAGAIAERKGGEATRIAMQWLAEHTDERAFLFLHYYDPHNRYEPPEPFASAFAEDLYAGEIAYTDHCVGRVLEHLKELGLYESALIVIAGDHGEMLGERGEATHSFFVYQPAVRVPMIVKPPGQRTARTVTEPVGLIDIAPTICSLLGIDPPDGATGQDLSRFWIEENRVEEDRPLYCESLTPTKYNANALFGVVTDRWKYIHTTRPELYDLAADPNETRNVVAEEPEVSTCLADWLNGIAHEWQERGTPDGVLALSEEDRRRLESLGYIANEGMSDDLVFDASREDPKDLIGFHEDRVKLGALLFERKYAKAKALCERMLAQRPDFGHGHVVLARIAMDQDDPAGAIVHLRRVVALNPDSFEGHYNLGNALAAEGKVVDAIHHLRRAVALDPAHAMAHCNLGRSLHQQGNAQAAMDCFRQALEIEPELAEAHYNLGVALAQKKDLDNAAVQYRHALKLKPNYAKAHANLGRVLQLQGRVDEAIDHLREAARIVPDSAETQCALAGVLMATGQANEALTTFRKVLKLEPDTLEALNGAAWILATCPDAKIRDPAEAVRLAEQASDLAGHKSADVMDTLAAAYASARQFDRAVATAQRALVLATAAAADELASDIRKRLALYRQGKPYRE